jgi:DNA-binding transcriptional MerR regulator
VPARKRAKRTTTSKAATPRGSRSKSNFSCPDCDFVAKHAMGLGRHRSARHGITSKRQSRRRESGSWLTRQEAARRAGVHYNTVRQWEQAGLLRRTRKPRVRGSLVSAEDLTRVLMDRTSTGGQPAAVADTAAVVALERRYNDLIAGIERLLTSAKAAAPATTPRRRGRPPGSRNRKTLERANAGPRRQTAGRKKAAAGRKAVTRSRVATRRKVASRGRASGAKAAAMRRSTAGASRRGGRRRAAGIKRRSSR